MPTSEDPPPSSIGPKPPPIPPAGVWVPAVTFFDPTTSSLLLPQQSLYYAHLSRSHLTGLVILGTNAETFLLTPSERRQLIACARSSVPANYPLMVGCSGHSTHQVLEFIRDAKQEGADYALVLPCAYFGPATSKEVVMRFFGEVAESAELPVVIYNFPGVCNGVDVDSDMIEALAKKYPGKIVGVKLTCGSVAKIVRLSASLKGPREDPERGFSVFGGQSDFLVGGLESGSAGCICAFGNVFPKSIKRIYDLWVKGDKEEATRIHRVAARAEQATKGGVGSVKYASAVWCASRAQGLEGLLEKGKEWWWMRAPYGDVVADGVKKRIREDESMKEMGEIERSL
ncbi:MAG: hypothetical protein Q9227_007094 [Pyrenula ochraceoflavens]